MKWNTARSYLQNIGNGRITNNMQVARILEHKMTVEFTCDVSKQTQKVIADNPSIQSGAHFSDWTYKFIEVVCPSCHKVYKLEI